VDALVSTPGTTQGMNMATDTKSVERLMKRCQIGVGRSNSFATANDIMAECYGTLGALVQERDKLLHDLWRMKQLLSVFPKDEK